MRSFRFYLMRLIGLALLLTALLTACAGDESSSGDDTNPDRQADTSSNTPAAAQATPAGEPLAALVNGQPITLAAFERERARRAVGLDIQPATAAAFDATVLQSMIDQLLIEQAAARDGITVTEAEIDSELAIQAEIAQASGLSFEEFVAAQQYTMEEYRAAQHSMLLWGKVSQAVVAGVPTVSVQVHARHILVADEPTARQLLAQLDQGADFAQLAMQYSLDGSTAPTGGDLDWISEGDLLQPEVERAIFALAPGTRAPDPVQSSLGYHIIESLERVEGRPLDEAALAEKKEQAFFTWLEAQRQAAQVERFVGTAVQ